METMNRTTFSDVTLFWQIDVCRYIRGQSCLYLHIAEAGEVMRAKQSEASKPKLKSSESTELHQNFLWSGSSNFKPLNATDTDRNNSSL
jgi:hypothetical protein